jgi:hypothetical protein
MKSSTKGGRSARSAAAPADARTAKLLAALSADPKLAASVRQLEKTQAAGTGHKFGSNALKANGKLFALFTQGTLVVKLPNDRVDALVAKGVGKHFDPGHGRLMKGWLTVVNPRASWVALVKEAHAFVSGAK